ncbi:MAG: ABC transporter permease subunit [Bacteroidetes bacterium]|nr:ABC transporter permease subunit [Bacteroidota bacterium]
MNRIIKYVILDILKNKTLIAYTLLLSLLTWAVFSLEDNTSKGMLTLLNMILLSVPLVSIMFSTIYIYNSSEFIELLLSQPIKRNKIYISLFIGLSLSMVIAFLLGAGIPILIFVPEKAGIMMVFAGCAISLVFVSISFLSSISTRDKSKGIGIALLVWLYFSLLFDGLILFLVFQFSDYPIEKAMIVISAFSPVDLVRILILLQLDVSVMMGYTGAIFKDFFGTTMGLSITFLLMCIWILVPFWVAIRQFNKKDL